jgi:hypothetical protein
MLKGNSAILKFDHLGGVDITRWFEEGELGFIVNRNGEMGSKFLERWMNLGFRQRGTVVFKDKLKQKIEGNTGGTEESDAFREVELEDAMDL